MEVLRGVDRVETVALALFVVIAGAAAVGVRWGMAAAAVATVLYAVMRRNALDISGSDSVNRMIFARAVGFVTFGALFGIANHVLRPLLQSSRQPKSPSIPITLQHDGVAALDREIALARRHGRPLSAITIDLTDSVNQRELRQAFRSSDVVLQTGVGDESTLTIILPETDAEGARDLAVRLPTSQPPRVISLLTDDASDPPPVEELDELRRRVALSRDTT